MHVIEKKFPAASGGVRRLGAVSLQGLAMPKKGASSIKTDCNYDMKGWILPLPVREARMASVSSAGMG